MPAACTIVEAVWIRWRFQGIQIEREGVELLVAKASPIHPISELRRPDGKWKKRVSRRR